MGENTNQSLDSMIQALEPYTRMGIEISPYLSAIQSLNGRTPGEKYRELNQLVEEIVKNKPTLDDDSTAKLVEVPQQVPASLAPLVKIRIGKALRSNEAVIEALTSEDIPVANQAFKAKWFFEASNDIVTADNFVNNVMPLVSKRVRFRIIKALSRGLRGDEKKAEEFHRAFVGLYGAEEALPLLVACSEKYIEVEVLRPKVLLTYEMLIDWEKKYPDLVINCLRRFARNHYHNNRDNMMMKKTVFEKFLPHLIRRHISVFIELYNSVRIRGMRLGRTNVGLFFKQADNSIVVKKAHIYKNLFSLKAISEKLSLQQFDVFFANLFPEVEERFDLLTFIKYLKFYPKERRENLFTSAYKAKYSKEFSFPNFSFKFTEQRKLVYHEISVDLFEKLFVKEFPLSPQEFNFDNYFNLFKTEIKYTRQQIFQLLDKASQEKLGKSLFEDVFSLNIDEKHKKALVNLMLPEKRVREVLKFLEKCNEKSDDYYSWYACMPPKKSLIFFKNAIAKSRNEASRHTFIESMVKSCAVDCNNDDLLDFLEYYNRRHKNESVEVSKVIFEILNDHYDPSKFEKSLSKALLEILWRAHTKSELTKCFYSFQIEKFFDAIVYQTLSQNEENPETLDDEDQATLNAIFEITIHCNLEGYPSSWMIVKNNNEENKTPECVWTDLKKRLMFQRFCFEKLMNLLPQKCPPISLPIWKKNKESDTKWNVALAIIKEVHIHNKLIDEIQKHYDSDFDIEKLSVKDYPCLMEIIKDSLQHQSYSYKLDRMSKYEPELVQQYSKENDGKIKREIITSRALVEMKKVQGSILDSFENYISKCRDILKSNTKHGGAAAKRLLLATKWHKDLPCKVIESCLRDLKEPSNLKVLGVMLEGDVFSKIVASFVPDDSSFDIHLAHSKDYYALLKALLPAMNLTSPPVSFDMIAMFCRNEYVKLAVQALTTTSQRVTKSKIVRFAEQLIDKPISVKKHGIRLLFKISSKDDLILFVQRIWKNEKHVSIRQMIAKLVKDRFILQPNDENWNLLQISIDALTENDDLPMSVLTNVKDIKTNYRCQYIKQLLNKIEQIPEPDQKDPNNVRCKFDWIGDLLETASDFVGSSEFLTEELILQIVEKYCFVEPSASTAHLLQCAETFTKNVFSRPFSTKHYRFSFNSNNTK